MCPSIRRTAFELTESLDEQTGAVTDNTSEIVAKKLQDKGAFDIAQKLGISLDTVTDAGRGIEAALDAIAQRALEAAASTLEQAGSQEEANAVLQAGCDRLIEMVGRFGITGQAAQDHVDTLELIPGNISTAVEVTGMDTATEKAYASRTALLTVAAAARKASQNIASGNSGAWRTVVSSTTTPGGCGLSRRRAGGVYPSGAVEA